MLTATDKKEIRKIVKGEVDPLEKRLRKVIREEVELRTDPLRGALVKIEQKLPVLDDILDFIRSHSRQLKDHEERIINLESSQGFKN